MSGDFFIPFVCVACERAVEAPRYNWRVHERRPICHACACAHTSQESWNGRSRKVSGSMLPGGTRGDRYVFQRLAAMTELLKWEAIRAGRS